MRHPSPDEIARFAEVAALTLALPLPDAYRPGVEANLGVAFRLSAHFLAVDLADEAEPAPVFHALAVSQGGENP